MAVIVDPDLLAQGVEVTITPATKKIQLNIAGDLSTDGVTLKCLYSFLKEEWKDDANLIKYPFPMLPITDEQFELQNGWDFDADATRYLIRTGGWALKDAGGVSLEEWAGLVTLGSLGGTDQVYFQQVTSGSATNIQLQGVVNQAVKVYGDSSHGNFDFRSYMKLFVREYQKTYGAASLSDIGVSTMTYQVYRFPLTNGSDAIKITHDDTYVNGNTPYTGMSITWYATPQVRTIGGVAYHFHTIIEGNGGTAEQIYEFVQHQLRQNEDIDAGSGEKIGKTAADLLRFVGDTLYTLIQTEGGVAIDNFAAADTNRLVFAEDDASPITYPYTAALTLNFGENLQNDASARYWVFFTNDDAGDNLGYDYGTANAIIVNNTSGSPMAGLVDGDPSVQLAFDYDGNVQRGAASAGDDAPITVVAIGLNTAQFIKATGTILKSIANVVSLVASLERNYQNP